MRLMLSVLTVAALAQAAPNFSGEWKMNIAKSDFGAFPAPELLTRSIKHTDPALQYSTHQKGASGDVTTEIKYTTDGKPCVNKINGADARGTAKWQGGTLIIESERDFQGVQIKSKETWTLAEGGKSLTINNHVSIPGQGEYDLKLVLDKQ